MATEVIQFAPPVLAALEPHEVDEAMAAAGVVGVINALVAKTQNLDPATIEAAAAATTWLPVRRCRDALSNHQQEPAIDHADSLEYVARQYAAVELVAAALLDAGMWLARSPGRVVPDPRVAGGMKRTFSRP